MRASDAFDEWAADGRDKGMEQRHWHTAKHALGRMPIEDGDTVLDLGCGSGYAARAPRTALREALESRFDDAYRETYEMAA
jgi:cyclopropane fatty-acyl-phospholipid synthase-like methyltransferase